MLQNPVLSNSSSKNRIHPGEWCGVQLPLFNNLIIANPCNVGVCPKKVELIMMLIFCPHLMKIWLNWWILFYIWLMVDILLNKLLFQWTDNWNQWIDNWKGYLDEIHTFLTWCFALNQHDYVKNSSYFYVNSLHFQKLMIS